MLLPAGADMAVGPRVIATTTYDNASSQRVMERLGMRIARNPDAEPHWLQIVGILEHASR